MKNKGMLFEKLINQTIDWLEKNKIAYIQKLNLPIKFSGAESDIKGNLWLKNVKVTHKSTVDYIGCYRGQFIAFEAKSTKSDRLEKSNIKTNQIEYLTKVNACGGLAFYLIYFEKYDQILCTPVDWILFLLKNENSLNIVNIVKNSLSVEILFPGILNLDKTLKFWN